MDMILKKVFVGLPQKVGVKDAKNPMEREWESGIFKQPIQGPVLLTKTGLLGDGQADRENHGGPEKAVFVYPFEHYENWQKELNATEIGPGAMGENFLLENVKEDMVAIGDTYQIGDAIVQVSQPRQPCWKPARRFKIKNLALLIQNSGRTGWYFRVLKEGNIEVGQKLTLIERPYPKWTISKCNEIMHGTSPNPEEVREFAQCELLAQNWKNTLNKRIATGETSDIRKRVIGPNE
ncbi:MOSC domain-containing protein [Schinkia azotoformans]|uniref:MOSC domain-containing protein n=1 Tax=Schinkia azotoformans TaxID=1454 RepID=UPI002E1F97A0|nr:MOSC domain-containing protein [Schinkia azotoformans]